MQLRRCIGLAFVASLCLGQEDKGPAILRPVNESVVKPGALSVVARVEGPSRLLLDGKAVAFQSPAPGVLTAKVNLNAGPHELSLEGKSDSVKTRIFAASPSSPAPAGWAEFRVHPPTAACDACHSVKDGAWAAKGASTAESCSACHNLQKFPQTHTHAVSVLEECQLCHEPHGSKALRHLRFPKETACKQCHG